MLPQRKKQLLDNKKMNPEREGRTSLWFQYINSKLDVAITTENGVETMVLQGSSTDPKFDVRARSFAAEWFKEPKLTRRGRVRWGDDLCESVHYVEGKTE